MCRVKMSFNNPSHADTIIYTPESEREAGKCGWIYFRYEKGVAAAMLARVSCHEASSSPDTCLDSFGALIKQQQP